MKRHIHFSAVLIFLWLQVAAQPADKVFQQANQAYQKNDYAAAASLYLQLLEEGHRSPELEYNLANAYYKMDSLGKAILHYEKALVLAPNDVDTKTNLDIARTQVKGELEILPEFFLISAWKKARSILSSTTWGIVALCMWWACFVGFAFWQFGKTRRQKKMGFFAGIIFLLFSVLPFSFAFSRMAYEQETGQAILVAESAALRSAPDQDGSELLTLYEGTKVHLLENLGGWWQVELSNGEKGWLDGRLLEEI